MPTGAPVADAPSVAPDESSPGTTWLTNDASQAALRELHAALVQDPAFAALELADAIDRMYVVLQPDIPIAETTAASIATHRDTLRLTIVTAPVPTAELEAAQEKLRQAAITSEATQYGFYVDERRGKIILQGKHDEMLELADSANLDESILELESTSGGYTRYSRGADAPPHYGGAFFNMWRSGICESSCTSGFTATNIFGVRGMLTAGHCGENGGDIAISGPHVIGYFVASTAFPGIDLGWLWKAGETYSNRIYTDPGSPTTRRVTSFADPIEGSSVCISGSFTKAVCNVIVMEPNMEWDYLGVGYPTHDLFMARKPGVAACGPGDSGGPIYKRGDGDVAVGAGIFVAGSIEPFPDGTVNCLGQRAGVFSSAGFQPVTN